MAQTPESISTKKETGGEPEFETMTPTQHVGPTLEAEGIFDDVLGDAVPIEPSSPDRVQQDQSGVDTANVRTISEDNAYLQSTEREDALLEQSGSDDTASTSAAISPGELTDESVDTYVSPLGETPEPLRTRLPGDTSSDPHTDLGRENATTAHGASEDE